MSGHSKWATTHRQKEANDAKRGKIFTKMANVITIAAREKGGDPDTNFSLRVAMDRARAVNMPKDNIEKAIKRGTGELEGAQIEELYYEGIGPANSQFIIKCLTDNKNRSASEVRHVFSKYGGSLGSVMWNFDKKGVIRILKEEAEKAELLGEEAELELIDQGAEDIVKEEEGMTIYTAVADLDKMKKYLDGKEVSTESADIEYVAKNQQEVSDEEKEKIEKFIEDLEESDDVSDHYTNVNI
ncbi:YebC/PmpR family DNA-binding transcriptional regulator [Candidatus Falkowbacteria bacterium]|nr:YebC/PmpR family DNA-binding transcriptional regulator [Candidatus Falkowbacteria bacterium]